MSATRAAYICQGTRYGAFTDKIKKGYDYVVENNYYYQFGRKILAFPRAIKHMLSAVKGTLKYGKK